MDEIVDSYASNQIVKRFLDTLVAQFQSAMEKGGPLNGLVHSLKYRMKDPEHLRVKLSRKISERRQQGRPFSVTAENLGLRITDLAGCRLLHLNTKQIAQIHRVLLGLIEEAQCELFEKPFAYVWDDEWRKYFRDVVGIRTKPSPRLYSSVHYVIRPNNKAKVTCEIQVRTLADEIWGEIDHRLNYPTPHESVACREQIVALARLGSSYGRLVDSIIASDEDFENDRRRRRR